MQSSGNWESIYLKTNVYHYHKDICSTVFIVALFIKAINCYIWERLCWLMIDVWWLLHCGWQYLLEIGLGIQKAPIWLGKRESHETLLVRVFLPSTISLLFYPKLPKWWCQITPTHCLSCFSLKDLIGATWMQVRTKNGKPKVILLLDRTWEWCLLEEYRRYQNFRWQKK